MVADIDGYDLSLALHWILESRNLLRRQIDACQHGKVVRQVATTKDLREMCQNGVTLDDLRRLYGVNATLEDLELVMPSPLIGDLGILPCSEVETKGLSESEESEDVEEEEWDQNDDVKEEEVRASQDAGKEEVSPSQDVGEEEVRASQDAGEGEISPSQVEKSKEALPLLSSMDQQAVREMEPQMPSFYDPLLALCLLSQSSNVLDVLTSLEILSRLT